MSAQPCLTVITKFLYSLKHTGTAGFEGLVVTLLESATGQRFRISGSGQQHGQDARSEEGIGNRIKVEAKHYEKAKLNLRELTSEIVQATTLGTDLDLWVLAASCPVQNQHDEDLETITRKHDIEILILDQGNDGLPRVAVLASAYADAVESWVNCHDISVDLSQLRTALTELRELPGFQATLKQILDKLGSTLLGYEDARHRARTSVLDALNDRGTAEARFNQRAAVRAEKNRIDRLRIDDDLIKWWSAAQGGISHAAILGEEGTGKTWAVFNWMANGLEADMMPIVLPFSGNAESIPPRETLEWLLPKLLRKWTGVASEETWIRRSRRWFGASGATRPLIVVVVDGLNENAALNWPSFFRVLGYPHWQGKVTVLATDRPMHWEQRCARAGLVDFQEIRISGYTDRELERVLAGRAVPIASIPHELQDLIRTPRYCDLVCEHFQEMKGSADFTRERLLFLDAKHHAETKRGRMSEHEFVDVIRSLATRYRERSRAISLGDIQDLVPVPDPDRQVHQEIIDGGLLVVKAGSPGTFVIERKRLVYGLGMLLAETVEYTAENGATETELREKIQSWFEPHSEMDLKVEICGSALFHAYHYETFPKSARREILRYWLGLRNVEDSAQRSFVHYVLRHPDDFIAMAEVFWSSNRDLGVAQEFLARALTIHRDDTSVQPALVRAVHRWMSFVHPAGHPMMRHDSAREKRMRAAIETRVGHPLVPGAVQMAGELLTVIEDDGFLRLSRLGLLIMSAETRAPFIGALVPWAVASAVMGAAIAETVADWVVRLSVEDLEEILLPKTRALLALDEPIATQAAHTLLWRLGTAAAKELRVSRPLPEFEFHRKLRLEHEIDPCKSLLPWNDADCQQCVIREDVHVLRIRECLGDRIYDPEFDLPESFVRRCCEILQLDPASYKASYGSTVEVHTLDSVLPILAARAARAAGRLHSIGCPYDA